MSSGPICKRCSHTAQQHGPDTKWRCTLCDCSEFTSQICGSCGHIGDHMLSDGCVANLRERIEKLEATIAIMQEQIEVNTFRSIF